MDATVGASVLMWTPPASSAVMAVPAPSPAIPTSSGRPAATSERSARMSTTSATTTPIPSVTLLVVMTFSGTSPPSATCSPSARAGAVARVSSSTPVVPLK